MKKLFLLSILFNSIVFAQTAELNRDNQSAISFLPENGDSIFHIAHGLNNDLNISQGTNVGGTSIMTIKNYGSIGIGTITPSAKLEIKSSGTLGGVWNPSASFFTISDSGSGSLIMDSNEIYSSSTLHIGSSSGDIVKFRSITGSSTSDKFTIKNNGYVGVGVTNPASLFDVRTTDGKGVWLNFNDESAVTFFPNNGNSVFHLSHGHDNKLHISQGGTVGAGKLMTFVNTGNVGIGTTSPDAKLAVKGNIHTQEVKVDLLGSAMPDYVFNKNYKLKTLKEVEDYINENGHLPNIPSAKDTETNGLLLKEINLKLLEKIEELTLYTIEQEKRIDSLEDKNKALEKESEVLKSLLERVKQLEKKVN